MLHPEFINHLNQEVYSLIKLIKKCTPELESKRKSEYLGSIKEKPFSDWTDKFVSGPVIEKEITITGEITSIKKRFDNKCYEIDRNTCQKITKMAESIYKQKNIQSKVGKDFIEERIIHWIMKTFENKKADNEFSNFLIDEIENLIENLKIRFKIINLEIEYPFYIGNIELHYLTKDFFSKLNDNKLEKDKLNGDKYIGQVFASCIIKAEAEKAQTIAYKNCGLAIDILKIFSLTLHFPNYKLIFDIDKRISFNPEFHEIILQNLNIENDFRLSFLSSRDGQTPYIIDKAKLTRMEQLGLNEFSNFIKQDLGTKLYGLIIDSIEHFANALSTRDLHKRISELFSILESLLLKDNKSPIQDSISIYLSKLVSNNIEERKKIIDIVKELYNVRSKMIHHFIKDDFKEESLQILQVYVLILLKKMIKLASKHETKESIINEIDAEILKAYQS
jgi:hypothetical protein